MAAQRVGSLPEIVQLIVENTPFKPIYGDDSGMEALFNYLTVNHLWFAETARVLWREVGLADLWRLPFDRRQVYANFVVDMTMTDECEQVRQRMIRKEKRWLKRKDRALKFPKLQSLDFAMFTDKTPNTVLTKFFVPTLRTVSLHGRLTDRMLTALVFNCKNLDEVTIGIGQSWRLTFPGVEMFARCCRIRRLNLPLCYTRLLYFLATNPKLEELRFPSFTTTTFTALMKLSLHTHTFKNLTHLVCIENSVAVEDILRVMPSLRGVVINVSELDDAIASLTMQPLLERVTLYASTGGLSLDIMRELVTKHRMLKKLDLRTPDPATHDELNDAWIQELTSLMPRLEHFGFYVNNHITCEALIPIGHNCPLLRNIEIKISYVGKVKSLADGSFLQKPGPVFKRLQGLRPPEWIRDLSDSQKKNRFPLIYANISIK